MGFCYYLFMKIYEFNVKKINGELVSLADYEGKVLLIVNVASKCGLTPQYSGLTELYDKYMKQGFEILAFPANEFLAQEPGTNSEIKEFCTTNFGVNFPLFEKIVVKGEGQHSLYKYLIESKKDSIQKKDGTLLARLRERGLLAGKDNDIKWNFEKFLINQKGEIIQRFDPDIDPMDPLIVEAVEHALASI